MDPADLVHDGRQQGHPVVVHADCRSSRHPETGRADQRLNLDQDRARPFHTRNDHRSCGALRPLRQEEGRRVVNFGQTGVPHFKNADLVGRTEAVLDSPDDPVGVTGIPLKIEDRIHHVFQDFRTRNRTVLRNMADQENRDPRLFGQQDEPRRRLPHLSDASRRGGEDRGIDGLDRIDDDRSRPDLIDPFHDILQFHLDENQQILCRGAEPFPAEFDLPGGLFTGYV